MKSNEELINTIKNIVAEIQSFDEGKNSYNNHSSEWKNRFDKLTNITMDYVKRNHQSYFVEMDKKTGKKIFFTTELFNALKNAVDAYNEKDGPFINYFLVIFKREIGKIKEKEYVNDRKAGIKLPDNKRRAIKK